MQRSDAIPRPSDVVEYAFFTRGLSIFTVSNPKGAHFTYKVRRSPKDAGLFVYVLTGPDNSMDYSYAGLLIAKLGVLHLTRQSRFDEKSPAIRVFRWAVNMVRLGRTLPEGYAIRHVGRCSRCGRLLTVPRSIERGVGPECERRGT